MAGSTVSVMRGTQESTASLMAVSPNIHTLGQMSLIDGQNEVFSFFMIFSTPHHTDIAFCLNSSNCSVCVNFTASNCSDSYASQCASEYSMMSLRTNKTFHASGNAHYTVLIYTFEHYKLPLKPFQANI